jgi:hypothetical protein
VDDVSDFQFSQSVATCPVQAPNWHSACCQYLAQYMPFSPFFLQAMRCKYMLRMLLLLLLEFLVLGLGILARCMVIMLILIS